MNLPPGPDYFDEGYYSKVGKDPHQILFRAAWLHHTFSPRKVLEIGCGEGLTTATLNEMGIDSVGLDISRWAAGLHPNSQLVADDANIPFRDKVFDLVYGFDIMEHNMEQFTEQIIAECARVCTANAFFNIALLGTTDNIVDETHFTLKPRSWWVEKFSPHFEVMENRSSCIGLTIRSAQFVLKVRKN